MEAEELLSKTKTAPESDLQLYNRTLLKNQATRKKINTPRYKNRGVSLLMLSTDSDFVTPIG